MMIRLLAVWTCLLVPPSVILIALAGLAGRVLPDSGKIVFSTRTHYHMADADSAVYINLSRRYLAFSFPWVAPDGQHLAWVSTDTVTSEILVADLLSYSIRTFRQPFQVYGLLWSRDSRKLAFEAQSDLYTLDTESGETRHVVDHPSGDWYPVWSPDERSIAFVSERDVGNWQIFTVEVDTQETRLLPCPDIPCTTPNWSPNGRYLTFDANSTLYVIDMQTLELQRLTDGKLSDPSWMPLWSPDNIAILFTSHTTPDNKEIYSYNWTNQQRQRLTDDPALDGGGIWSPDGRQIAFSSDRAEWRGIYVMDAGGGNLRLLIPDSVSPIAWVP